MRVNHEKKMLPIHDKNEFEINKTVERTNLPRSLCVHWEVCKKITKNIDK